MGWNFAASLRILGRPLTSFGALAPRLALWKCVCLDMSSISRHTWLNTSPGYLLHIKQHLSCTYLARTKALCSQVQSSACRRPELCKPPAAPISIPCLLNTISGTWELPCFPTVYISPCLWYSFNAERIQRGFFLSVLGESPCWVLQEQSRPTEGLPGCKVPSEAGGRGKEWQVLFTAILSPNGFGRAGLCWS